MIIEAWLCLLIAPHVAFSIVRSKCSKFPTMRRSHNASKCALDNVLSYDDGDARTVDRNQTLDDAAPYFITAKDKSYLLEIGACPSWLCSAPCSALRHDLCKVNGIME